MQRFAHQRRLLSMKAWFVTFSVFNSRVSQRAAYYRNVQKNSEPPLLLTLDEQNFVTGVLQKTARKHVILLLRLAVLPDHVHIVVMAEDKNKLSALIHKLKGASGYYLNRKRNMPKGTHAWTKKFDYRQITDMEHLEKACKYVDNNHLKHNDRWE